MADLDRLCAKLVLAGFPGREIEPEFREVLRRGVAQAIVFTRNVGDPAVTAGVCAAVKRAAAGPLAVAVDQEGGRVARLADGFEQLPPMRAIGSLAPRERLAAASAAGRTLAHQLRQVHIDIDFAPVVDVDSNPANPVIGERSFSADPAVVAECAAALIAAMQEGGVAACAKHFPGHGDTDTDSHLELPRLAHGMDRLRQVELPPFAAAARAGVASVMTAHVVFEKLDPGVPATLSRSVVTGLLREEVGFSGLIYSDCLEMKAIADRIGTGEAAVRAIRAGCDTVLVCHTHSRQHEAIDALAREARTSEAFRERVVEAAARVDALLSRFARPA